MEQAVVETRIQLGVGRLLAWDHLVRPGSLVATIEPALGGRVADDGRVGFVREWEPGSLLAWEWSRDGDPGWSIVTVELVANDEGTLVTVRETLHAWEFEYYGAPSHDLGRSGRSRCSA